jgi:hypothetical protein
MQVTKNFCSVTASLGPFPDFAAYVQTWRLFVIDTVDLKCLCLEKQSPIPKHVVAGLSPIQIAWSFSEVHCNVILRFAVGL